LCRRVEPDSGGLPAGRRLLPRLTPGLRQADNKKFILKQFLFYPMQSNIPRKLIGNNNMHDNYSEDIVLVFKQ